MGTCSKMKPNSRCTTRGPISSETIQEALEVLERRRYANHADRRRAKAVMRRVAKRIRRRVKPVDRNAVHRRLVKIGGAV